MSKAWEAENGVPLPRGLNPISEGAGEAYVHNKAFPFLIKKDLSIPVFIVRGEESLSPLHTQRRRGKASSLNH